MSTGLLRKPAIAGTGRASGNASGHLEQRELADRCTLRGVVCHCGVYRDLVGKYAETAKCPKCGWPGAHVVDLTPEVRISSMPYGVVESHTEEDQGRRE